MRLSGMRAFVLSSVMLFLGLATRSYGQLDEMPMTIDNYNHYCPVVNPYAGPSLGESMEGVLFQKADANGYLQIWHRYLIFGSSEIADSSDAYTHYDASWLDRNHILWVQHDAISGYHQVVQVATDDGTKTRLTTSSKDHSCPHRNPSTDTLLDFILYLVDTNTGDSDVAFYDISGATEYVLNDDTYEDYCPQWNPSGNSYVWIKKDATGYRQVYRALLLDAPIALTSDSHHHDVPQWSPDGNTLVFLEMDASGYYQVVKMPATGGVSTPLTSGNYPCSGPQWSPDGNWILYSRMDTNAIFQLFKVPAAGGTAVQLTNDGYPHGSPQWSVGGQWIVYAKPDYTGYQQIYRIAVNQGPWTDVGWVRSESMSACGLLLYGNKVTQGMAGLGCMEMRRSGAIPHFVSDSTWYTGLVVANTEAAQASVKVTAYDKNGVDKGAVTLTIPPYGKVSQLMSAMFPSVTGSGWLRYESDRNCYAFDLYGDKLHGGIAALQSVKADRANDLVLAHFVCNSSWWSGIAVLNPNPRTCPVTLTAYDDAGTILGTYSSTLNSLSKVTGYADTLIPGCASKSGWIRIHGDYPVSAVLTYGTKKSTPAEIGAISATEFGVAYLDFAFFRSDAKWSTGIALINPGSSSIEVTAKAYDSSGGIIDQQTLSLAAGAKKVGLVGASTLLPGAANRSGWIGVTATGTLYGLEILNANDSTAQAWGFAAIESQYAGTPVFPHYDVSSNWWTFLAMGQEESGDGTAFLWAHANDGTAVGARSRGLVPRNASIVGQVKSLLEIE